ncbi:hypothetical protein RO3G_04283 [Rhizopus delemar RA 99-880]|uniref:Uncharacterized protein n=1 Tax=Rhizopus delemar (strain RA 99-880 / ATCC MYA-4621 / FGSC 9543 / NRRL 43880) TaxID=246409 RepID=I1BTP8_RHIO9|nr:hypothetical protein RO3G_04283 [Rhizopus delemar RA 99-880]|eukprot:EIE79578.1 hypothetical protein RO3G_04283 [Rhizopus delemar RA 99-880]
MRDWLSFNKKCYFSSVHHIGNQVAVIQFINNIIKAKANLLMILKEDAYV